MNVLVVTASLLDTKRDNQQRAIHMELLWYCAQHVVCTGMQIEMPVLSSVNV